MLMKIGHIFSLRLQNVLPKIYQNGYIMDYFIRTIIDIINFTDISKKDYLIIFLDLEKTF